MSLPRISIVTPSLNQGDFLEHTIQSVINQNYPNLEYIIIDGGSSDNSVEIIKKYEDKLHYWCSEPDRGHYDAVNKGFSKATGEIFAWLNSDDLHCPWALQTAGSIFSQFEKIRWLTTLNQLVWDKNGNCISLRNIQGFSKEAFLAGCYFSGKRGGLGYIQQESTFWRRNLWKEVGGLRLEYPLAGDFDLWSRFYQFTELYGTPSPLGGFRLHEKNRSLDFSGYQKDAERSLEEVRMSSGWKPTFTSKIEASVTNKYELNGLTGIILRKAFHKFTASNVVSNLSDSQNGWNIVHKKFTRI